MMMMMMMVWQMGGWIMIHTTLMLKTSRKLTRNMAALEVPMRMGLKLRSGERLKLRRGT